MIFLFYFIFESMEAALMNKRLLSKTIKTNVYFVQIPSCFHTNTRGILNARMDSELTEDISFLRTERTCTDQESWPMSDFYIILYILYYILCLPLVILTCSLHTILISLIHNRGCALFINKSLFIMSYYLPAFP